MLARELAEAKGTNYNGELKDIDVFFEHVGKHLENGNSVQILGQGTFEPVKRAQKKGMDFKSGKQVDLPPRTLVKFRPGKKLAERVRVNDK